MAARLDPDGLPEPRVTMAAFDRAMSDEEAENALFAIASLADLDDERPERVMTAAELDALEARAEARAEARGGWAVVYDEAAAAALAPLPDFELTDAQCINVAGLLAPYASGE